MHVRMTIDLADMGGKAKRAHRPKLHTNASLLEEADKIGGIEFPIFAEFVGRQPTGGDPFAERLARRIEQRSRFRAADERVPAA